MGDVQLIGQLFAEFPKVGIGVKTSFALCRLDFDCVIFRRVYLSNSV